MTSPPLVSSDAPVARCGFLLTPARAGLLPLFGLVLLEEQEIGDGGTEPHLIETLLVCVEANCNRFM